MKEQRKQKESEELEFRDDFMFGKVMEEPIFRIILKACMNMWRPE